MIKRLKLSQFQIHKKKEIEFTNGVNVIIGETNEGKSAIIRSLYMLLENQPRGADKIFHRKGAKQPIEIELEDVKGNIIKRKKKKYSLNGVDFKAFNKEVPQPIRELFPLKPINWHKQLDPHYLILSTPGAAAKVLSASTGLEEQEEIVKEIKDRLSECKSEIKRLSINNHEAKSKMKQLRPVVKYLMQARSIKAKGEEFEKNQEEISEIEELINRINNCDKKIRKHDIEQYLSEITKILDLIKELEKSEEEYQNLIDIQSKLQDDNHIDEVILTNFIKEINEINKNISLLSENALSHSTLQKTLNTLQSLDNDLKQNEKEIKEKEEEFNKVKKSIGVCDNCPLF